jgi:hypothetical protein
MKMNEEYQNFSAKELAKLIGWTITKVDPDHESLAGEAVARLTLTKQGLIREVTVCRGCEIYLEADQILRGQKKLYQNFSDMLNCIQDFILDSDADTKIDPVENVMERQIGFQCSQTNKSWWINLTDVKNSTPVLRKLALTPESRQQMAFDLSQGFMPPAPKMD